MAPALEQHVRLLGDLALGLGLGGELLEPDDQIERVHAGCVDRRHAGVVASLLEQQPSVFGDHPAGPPRHVVAGDAVDVGDVEAVAVDRDAGVRHGLVS